MTRLLSTKPALRIALWSILLAGAAHTTTDPDLWGHVRFGLDSLLAGPVNDRLQTMGEVLARRLVERPPAVIHSYSGPLDYAREALDLGLAVSFSGLVFRRGEEASADVAPIVPAEKLLIETDSPFLSPPGAPRSRNQPEWVRVTGQWAAERRGTTLDALGPDLIAAYDRTFPSPRRTS